MSEKTVDNLRSLRRHLERLVEDEKDQVKQKGHEKRRHERHLYMVEATGRYVKRFDALGRSQDEFPIITKDISRSGLCFLHEHEMYAGEIIEVELSLGGAKKIVLLKIARCRRAGLKVFNIAGVYLSPEEEEAARAEIRKARNSPAN